MTSVFAFGIYILLNWLFPLPTGGTYFDQFVTIDLWKKFFSNLGHYIAELQIFFHPRGTYNTYKFLGHILSSFAMCSLVIGIFNKFRENIDFVDFMLIGYIGILIIWPHVQGFRFLLPILPFLLHYMVIGLKRINIKKLNKKLVTGILTGIMLALYYHRVLNIINMQDEIVKGPQEIKSVEAFKYIKENTPDNSIIVFIKPRVLSLYTDRKSIVNSHNGIEDLEEEFSYYNVSYLLVHNEISDSALTSYIDKNKVHLLWDNEVFYLYKRHLH